MHGGQGELPETAVCELGPHCWVRTAGSRRMDRCWPHGVGRALLAEGAEADRVALCGPVWPPWGNKLRSLACGVGAGKSLEPGPAGVRSPGALCWRPGLQS